MPKILVVENDADVREDIALSLQNAGYEVIAALDGQAGLELAGRQRPDLIVLDAMLPVMDGFELYKKLKAERITAIIPVLVLSDRTALADTFKTMGADGFLIRPFAEYALLGKVADLLSRPAVLAPPRLPSRNRKKVKVLIADVYEEPVKSMSEQLREQGHQVKTVLEASEVISKVITFEPDLLLMNIQISGGCTAPEAIEVIHLLPKFKRLPIVAYNFFRICDLGSRSLHEQALSCDALQLACIEAGAREYIGPYSEVSFLRTINKYLR